jgi:hypothetical protein
MISVRTLMVIAVFASCCGAPDVATAQDKAMPHLPAADGGVFVTPVAGAPFSAEVVRVMTRIGIARSGRGRALGIELPA